MTKQLLFGVKNGPASILGFGRGCMFITYTLKFMLLFGVRHRHGPASILCLDRGHFFYIPAKKIVLQNYDPYNFIFHMTYNLHRDYLEDNDNEG